MGNDWEKGDDDEPEMVLVDTGTQFAWVRRLKSRQKLPRKGGLLCGAMDGDVLCKAPAPCAKHYRETGKSK